MRDPRLSDVIQREESLFTKRAPILSLWQDLADNFYPERADFTVRRDVGDEFAEGLMSSYPILVRRDLGNSLGAMLRPSSQSWFEASVLDDDSLDHAGREYLQYVSNIQRRAIMDRHSQFTRATKEGDHDFSTFGQAVISVELNREGNRLLYRNWHLRDCAWQENAEGVVDTVYRRWKPTVRMLKQWFGKKLSPEFLRKMEKDPYREVPCRHVVMPAEEFDMKTDKPYVSIYYEMEEGTILEEVALDMHPYVVPRWQTVSGSQYAYSPASITALPDARLIQSMTRVLLEAGEKTVDPPLLAVEDAIRTDISLYAGGITWVDEAYDERLGEVLRPLSRDRYGLPAGFELQQDVRNMLTEAFYLNKLTLPPSEREMTAFETGQRVSEYIRQALPIFEPMEDEYNGALMERTFDLMMRNGGFGPKDQIPDSLAGRSVQFQFQNPLRDTLDSQKPQQLIQTKNLLAQVIDLDPSMASVVDVQIALRDALNGAGVPMRWLRDEQSVEQIKDAEEAQQTAQRLLDTAGQGAAVAEQFGNAQQALREGEGV